MNMLMAIILGVAGWAVMTLSDREITAELIILMAIYHLILHNSKD